jgi:predicted membrane-bound spermidine synthase
VDRNGEVFGKTFARRNFLKQNKILLALFLMSGFAALIYQIVWQRALFQAFGVNIESVTVIVSIFMLGLGVGSLTGGLLSRRFPNSLPQLFILCEIIIGIFGLFSLQLITYVTQANLNSSLFEISIATYGLLLIPTMFMGATLPILVTYLYRSYQSVGKSISMLYFINTLGSGIACFATAYIIFLYTGLKTATTIAAICNFSAALLGYRFICKGSRINPDIHTNTTEDNLHHTTTSRFKYGIILVLSMAVGIISLSQEILWIRIIGYTTGGTAKAFPLVLGTFLFGIAFGSLRSRAVCERNSSQLLGIIARILIISSLTYYLLVPISSWSFTVFGKGGYVIIFGSIGIIAYLTGMVLPLLSHFAITSFKAVGFSLSWIYFFNIIGSTAGSLLTGFFMLQWFSIEKTILFVSIMTFALGIFLFLAFPDKPVGRPFVKIAVLAAISLLLFSLHGVFYKNILERFYHKREYFSGAKFKYSLQNRQGIINVIPEKAGDDIIIGGGKYDGRFNTDLIRNRNIIDRAYMAAALHSNLCEVLEIGMSSASWARVITNNTNVKKLDIVEINPGYITIANHYEESRSVINDKRVTIYIDDGRRWLKRNPSKTYDLILMNTTFYYRDQANNLLSLEFLNLCKHHLKKGGVLYYNTTNSIDIPYTAANVFNYVVRYGSFLAASDSPFPTSFEEKRAAILKFTYHGKPIGESDDPKIEKWINMMASAPTENLRDSILANAANTHLITDDNLASEFKTRKTAFSFSLKWLRE